MEVAAWVACTKFDCHIEGGFVRDWVVRGFTRRPPKEVPISQWLQKDPQGRLDIHPQLQPVDVDVHLPFHRAFDVVRFVDQLRRLHIEVNDIVRDGWRYVLYVDINTPTVHDVCPITLAGLSYI